MREFWRSIVRPKAEAAWDEFDFEAAAKLAAIEDSVPPALRPWWRKQREIERRLLDEGRMRE